MNNHAGKRITHPEKKSGLKDLARTFWREDSGQAMCEFAIAFPLQLIIFFGIMQLSLIYMSTLVVDMTAYRVARSALVDEDIELDDDESGIPGAYVVAETLLAPLTLRSLPSGTELYEGTYIPGWGTVDRSDYAEAKTNIYIDKPDSNLSGKVTATVEYNQEFAFPFIDSIYRMFMGIKADENESTEYVFGNQFEKDEETGETTGNIRMIGGNAHFVIIRSCTLWRTAGIDEN